MITLLFIFEAPSQLFHTSRVRFRDKSSLETETRLQHQYHDDTLFPSALATSLTPRRNISSSRWSPVSISTCTPDTAPYYAPCLAQRLKGAIYGEELLYPNFRLREPIFAPTRVEHDRQEWRKLIGGIRDRAHWCKEDGWICYSGQSGQNIILANATYAGNPPADSWVNEACMGDGVTTTGFGIDDHNNNLISQDDYNQTFPIDSLVIATTPDSWSFQHFLDRVTHVISQSHHLTSTLPSPSSILAGRSSTSTVSQLWEMLGWTRDRIFYGSPKVSAKNVVFSCRAPLIHPFLSYRTLELLEMGEEEVGIEDRKKIVYFSRSRGGTSNGGRRVANEGDLLKNITQLLQDRNRGEELVIFDQNEFGSQKELMGWFRKNVRAIVGPHGGGLFNHRWTPQNTLVIEFITSEFTSLMFWEESSILNQLYVNMFLDSVGYLDMLADIPAVLDVLNIYLGKTRQDVGGNRIEEMYRWNAPEFEGLLGGGG
ncbi:hypothetical protein C8Q75DRAFT_728354 [Abortiporus biennis]|nr:hypothetical protein C8Q75DRAFT_728354 [Abortiporus biennis]